MHESEDLLRHTRMVLLICVRLQTTLSPWHFAVIVNRSRSKHLLARFTNPFLHSTLRTVKTVHNAPLSLSRSFALFFPWAPGIDIPHLV